MTKQTEWLKRKLLKEPEYRKQIRIMTRSTYKRRREMLFEILGGKQCSCKGINCWHEGKCILTDMRCLQIDHINGGETKEHRKYLPNNVYTFYKNNPEITKQKLQILCANCNWVKRHNNVEI